MVAARGRAVGGDRELVFSGDRVCLTRWKGCDSGDGFM